MNTCCEDIVIDEEIENPVENEVGTAAGSVPEELFGQQSLEGLVKKMN